MLNGDSESLQVLKYKNWSQPSFSFELESVERKLNERGIMSIMKYQAIVYDQVWVRVGVSIDRLKGPRPHQNRLLLFSVNVYYTYLSSTRSR